MSWLLLDDEGHVLLTEGRVTLLEDADPVARQQLIEARLRAARREWFADLDDGVGYDAVLGDGPENVDAFRASFLRALLETAGVASGEVTSIVRRGRELVVTWRAQLTSGDAAAGEVAA